MLGSLRILSLASLLLMGSGCAGHKELKAPCASEKATALLSSVAFADETSCGPMVRQTGVSVF